MHEQDTRELWTALAAQIATANEIGAGTRVGIVLTDESVIPAVDALVTAVHERGGHPQVVAGLERHELDAVASASDEVLATPSPAELWLMGWADVHVAYRGMVPPPASPPDATRLATLRRAKGVVSTARWQETEWTLVRIPTRAWAERIDVPYERLLSELSHGVLADWPALRRRWARLCEQLDACGVARITAPDTDLRLGIRGRRWVAFAGEANLPDGEIATAPLDDEVDGHIAFPGRTWFAGAEIVDLRLEFERGRCTGVEAAEGADLARLLLETDAGASTVGELGVGTNAGMSTMTHDLLIDEKILGTVHIALGRAYPECGGTNESALHWDIVKDLRECRGSLLVDDEPLIDEGSPTEWLVEA